MDTKHVNASGELAAIRLALEVYAAERMKWPQERRAHVEQELADLLVTLVRLSDRLNIDIFSAGDKILSGKRAD